MSKPYDHARSEQWPRVRLEFLRQHPLCVACGGSAELEVHHVEPFHLQPKLELDPQNLITLCEAVGHTCHFVFGHFHNWLLFNPNVREDVARYRTESDRARSTKEKS